MTTSLSPRYLAVSVLTLVLAWALGAPVANAKGPASGPTPDFTVVVNTDFWEPAWYPEQQYGELLGTFSTTGGIVDAGNIYRLFDYQDTSSIWWTGCLFVGEAGSFEADLPSYPENHGEYPFTLANGKDAYAVQATGTTTASVREKWYWLHSPFDNMRWKQSYRNVCWTINAYLPPQ